MKEKRLVYFDGMKGLAAVCIICYHYYTSICAKDVSLIPIPLAPLFVKGSLAVELFFMISGFLSARLYAACGGDIFSIYI